MKEIQIELDIAQNPTLSPQWEENGLQPAGGPTSGSVPLSPIDLSVWAQTGVDIALTNVERVKGSLLRSAELFREEDSARANRFFAQCVEGLQRFMEAITRTKAALQLDFSKLSTENGSLADIEKSLLFILKGMFQNQERKEYEEIADKIEYELITNLSCWTSALKNLRNSLLSGN